MCLKIISPNRTLPLHCLIVLRKTIFVKCQTNTKQCWENEVTVTVIVIVIAIMSDNVGVTWVDVCVRVCVCESVKQPSHRYGKCLTMLGPLN